MWRNGNWSVGIPFLGESLQILGASRHVAAGAEPFVGAGDADGIQLGLFVSPDRCPLDAAVHVLRERVASLDAVDLQVQHPSFEARMNVAGAQIGRCRFAHARP